MSQRVIVAGGTGLVGSHLVVELLKCGGYEVHCTVRSAQSAEKLREVCEWWGVDFSLVVLHTIDLCSDRDILGLLSEVSPSLYFHLAAQVSLDGADAQNMIRGNVDMSEALCSAMYEYNIEGEGSTAVVFVSSIAAIGGAKVSGGEIDESCEIDHIHSLEPYSLSKFLSENVMWRLSRMGVPVVMVNPSVVLGISGSSAGGSGIETALRMLSRGLPFYTKAEMGFVDVRDVARVMRLLSDRLLEELSEDSAAEGVCLGDRTVKTSNNVIAQRFIVSGGNYTYKELIGTFAKTNSKKPPRIYLSRWAVRCGIAVLGAGSFLVGKKPKFTKSMIGFLTSSSRYSTAKLQGVLPELRYHTLSETAEMIAKRRELMIND